MSGAGLAQAVRNKSKHKHTTDSFLIFPPPFLRGGIAAPPAKFGALGKHSEITEGGSVKSMYGAYLSDASAGGIA